MFTLPSAFIFQVCIEHVNCHVLSKRRSSDKLNKFPTFFSNFQTASRNRRTAAVATKDANSRPKTKSVEEWELEYEYDQVLKGNIYKNETKLNQLAQWVNPTTFFGSSIFIYVGYLIFTKVGVY